MDGILRGIFPADLYAQLATAPVFVGVVLNRFKAGMIPTLAGCCAAGIVLFLLGAHS